MEYFLEANKILHFYEDSNWREAGLTCKLSALLKILLELQGIP